MKSVLLNDFIIIKETIKSYLIIIILIFATSFYILGDFTNRFLIIWISIMTVSMRSQIIFSEKFEDLEKFMTMPVSAEDYSLSKIIRNCITIFISYLLLMAVVLIFNREYFPATIALIALDIMLTSFFHIIYTDKLGLIIVLIYTALLFIIGSILVFNWENFSEYKFITAITSLFIGLLSIYLDYKVSTNLLEARKI